MPPPQDLLSDPDIAQAYDDVRSDKSDTTWMVLKYASAASDNLKLEKSGTGDITEMCESLGNDEAAYAYIRMKLGNDEYSERVKFVFVVWQGKWLLCSSLRLSGMQANSMSDQGVYLHNDSWLIILVFYLLRMLYCRCRRRVDVLFVQVHRRKSCGKRR